MISRSVPQMPIAWVWTRTVPSPGGGSGTSASATEPCSPGTTVRARMALTVADNLSGPSAGDAVQDPVKDRGALLPGLRRVLGSRDVERALVEGADEDVGEGDDGLGNDRAGIHRRLQRELDEAEAVAAGHVPPCLPAEHRRGVKQGDPLDLRLGAGVEEQTRADPQARQRVRRGFGRTGRDPFCDLGLDLFGYGGEKVGLVAELVVQGAACYPGRPHDLLGAHAGVAARAEQGARRSHQLPPGRLRAEIVLGPGHHCAAALVIRTV